MFVNVKIVRSTSDYWAFGGKLIFIFPEFLCNILDAVDATKIPEVYISPSNVFSQEFTIIVFELLNENVLGTLVSLQILPRGMKACDVYLIHMCVAGTLGIYAGFSGCCGKEKIGRQERCTRSIGD